MLVLHDTAIVRGRKYLTIAIGVESALPWCWTFIVLTQRNGFCPKCIQATTASTVSGNDELLVKSYLHFISFSQFMSPAA